MTYEESHIGILLGRSPGASEDFPVFVCEFSRAYIAVEHMLAAATALRKQGYIIKDKAGFVYVNDIDENYGLEITIESLLWSPPARPVLFSVPKWDAYIGILLGRRAGASPDSRISPLYVVSYGAQVDVSDSLLDTAADLAEDCDDWPACFVAPQAFVFKRDSANLYSLVKVVDVSAAVLAEVYAEREDDKNCVLNADPDDPEWTPF